MSSVVSEVGVNLPLGDVTVPRTLREGHSGGRAWRRPLARSQQGSRSTGTARPKGSSLPGQRTERTETRSDYKRTSRVAESFCPCLCLGDDGAVAAPGHQRETSRSHQVLPTLNVPWSFYSGLDLLQFS